ncbi:MAG: hypothetical protein QOJ35_2343 [Solirubrobacteraceae bacterium]|nr:hypothetical protein [Solirubrobacteraceae bacterium]
MRLVIVLLYAVLLAAADAPAAAAAGGFGTPVAVGAGPVVTATFLAAPVAALGAAGDGAIAWAGGGHVSVARRPPAGAWSAQVVATRADEVRDLQLAVTAAGDTVLAWTHSYADGRHLPDRLFVATARRGRRFGRALILASGPRSDAALPRMALLGDGHVVLVWRKARAPSGGELQLAFLGSDGRFGRSSGTGADGVAPAIVATSDGGAVVAWATPAGFHASHALRAARLPTGGDKLGRSFEFSASAVEGARLAAGPGNVVIASWASKQRPVGLFAAQLAPRRGAAYAVRSGARAATGPPIAVGPGGVAVATFVAATHQPPPPEGGSPGSGQWVATGSAAGALDSRMELATPSLSLSVGPASPTILPSGEALVAWSQDRFLAGGRRVADVLVARRPPGATAFASIEPLGSGDLPRRMPVALARFDATVLVAWPAPGKDRGMLVADRR